MPDFIWRGLALALVGATVLCTAVYFELGLVPALIAVGVVFLCAAVIVAYWSVPGRNG